MRKSPGRIPVPGWSPTGKGGRRWPSQSTHHRIGSGRGWSRWAGIVEAGTPGTTSTTPVVQAPNECILNGKTSPSATGTGRFWSWGLLLSVQAAGIGPWDALVPTGDWDVKHRPPAADPGFNLAMKGLARLLEQRDELAEAETWYRRAAEVSDSRAMNSLGVAVAEAWSRRTGRRRAQWVDDQPEDAA